jgi:hypothetical protein
MYKQEIASEVTLGAFFLQQYTLTVKTKLQGVKL